MNLAINTQVFDSFPNISTERLNLRSFSLTDTADFYLLRNDREVMEYMDTDSLLSLEESTVKIQQLLIAFSNKRGVNWILEEKESKKFMGYAGFWKIDNENNRCEIGYALHPSFWGKGYMFEALKKLIHWGFHDLQTHSIEANINPKNERSRKLLIRLGFKKEAYFRENYFYNNVYYDSEIYSLLELDNQIKR